MDEAPHQGSRGVDSSYKLRDHLEKQRENGKNLSNLGYM